MNNPKSADISEQRSPRHSPSPTSTEAWEQVDQQLIEWGEQLDQLWSHSRDHVDLEQEKIILELETQYNSVRDEILIMQQRAESPASLDEPSAGSLEKAKEQLADLQDSTAAKAQEMTDQFKETISGLSDRVRSGEALDDLKDATARAKTGAAELSEGFSRAWDELKNAFETAGNRMKEEPRSKPDAS